MARFILLGTGTGVGKTYVGAALARALHRVAPAASVLALKPVESGIPADSLEDLTRPFSPPQGSDARLLADSSVQVALPARHPLYPLPDPVSPHLAARSAHVTLSLPAIASWVAQAESAHTSTTAVTLLETAGAVLSPFDETTTNFDLARALDPARWILVAPDALGVLHDVRATLLALHALGREPDYLDLNAARTPDASTGTNAHELRHLGIRTVDATLGHGDDRSLDAFAARLLSDLTRP